MSSAGVGRLGFWPTVRLFMMPFCVSSFAALVKGKGFYLVFSPQPMDYSGAVRGVARSSRRRQS